MLKRARASSPPRGDYDEDEEDAPRAVKRVRFVGPDAWDRNARQQRVVATPRRRHRSPEYNRVVQYDDEDMEEEQGDSEETEVVDGSGKPDAEDDGDSRGQTPDADADSPAESTPTPVASSSYSHINTLLHDLNAARSKALEERKLRHPYPTATLTPPRSPQLPSAPILRSSRFPLHDPDVIDQPSRALGKTAVSLRPSAQSDSPFVTPITPVHRELATLAKLKGRHLQYDPHRPNVSSPLRQGTVQAKEVDSGEGESESVRARYEEMNRLLGSLVLSRRRNQSEDETD